MTCTAGPAATCGTCPTHLQQGQLVHHLPRCLTKELASLQIPGSTLQVQARDVAAMPAIHRAMSRPIFSDSMLQDQLGVPQSLTTVEDGDYTISAVVVSVATSHCAMLQSMWRMQSGNTCLSLRTVHGPCHLPRPVASTHSRWLLLHLAGLCVACDLAVQRAPVQRPPPIPAGCLHQRCKVGLWRMQASQPHHFGLTLLSPRLQPERQHHHGTSVHTFGHSKSWRQLSMLSSKPTNLPGTCHAM